MGRKMDDYHDRMRKSEAIFQLVLPIWFLLCGVGLFVYSYFSQDPGIVFRGRLVSLGFYMLGVLLLTMWFFRYKFN